MTVATYEDVGVALGRSITETAEQAQIDHWLTGVELAIVAKLGPVAGLDAETVKYVEAEAVAEKFRRRGRAESSVTVSVDDGSVTRRYDQPAGAQDITDEWWSLLTPADDSHAAFTISPYSQRQTQVPDPRGWCR